MLSNLEDLLGGNNVGRSPQSPPSFRNLPNRLLCNSLGYGAMCCFDMVHILGGISLPADADGNGIVSKGTDQRK